MEVTYYIYLLSILDIYLIAVLRFRNSIERGQKLKAWIQHYGVKKVGPYVKLKLFYS